jgi:biotin transporter BioY
VQARYQLAAEIALYPAGLTWLALYADLGPAAVLREGLTPFIAGDIIKAVSRP